MDLPINFYDCEPREGKLPIFLDDSSALTTAVIISGLLKGF